MSISMTKAPSLEIVYGPKLENNKLKGNTVYAFGVVGASFDDPSVQPHLVSYDIYAKAIGSDKQNSSDLILQKTIFEGDSYRINTGDFPEQIAIEVAPVYDGVEFSKTRIEYTRELTEDDTEEEPEPRVEEEKEGVNSAVPSVPDATNSSGGFQVTYTTCGAGTKVIIDKQPLEETPSEPIYPDLIAPMISPDDYVEITNELSKMDEEAQKVMGHEQYFSFEDLVRRGIDIAKIFFNYEDFKRRSKIYDARDHEFESKVPNFGKPINNNDPFPIDEKIEEMQTHLPFTKIHRLWFCEPHPHTVQLAKIIMDLSDKTEKRLIQLENNMATVMRNLHRVGSRMQINCVYYGGQSEYEKYKTIRCLHHDRIEDGQLMTLEQCLNCTRYEPIIGKVYEILDETGQSLNQINDDNQMSYTSMQNQIEFARLEEKPTEVKKSFIDLNTLTERKEGDIDFKDIWDEGFIMDWELVPAEKQTTHVIYDDGQRTKRIKSSYKNIEHHNDPTGAGFEGIGIFYGPPESFAASSLGYGGGGSGGSGGGFTGTGSYNNLVPTEEVQNQIKANDDLFNSITDSAIRGYLQNGESYAKSSVDATLKRMEADGWEEILREECEKLGFDQLLALALITVESTGQVSPAYDNRAGDRYWGLMQVDKDNLSSNYSSKSALEKARENIRVGIKMFQGKLKTCWNTTNIMVGCIAYNSGEGAIKGASSRGVKPIYEPNGPAKSAVDNWTYEQIYKNLERNARGLYGEGSVNEKLTYYPRVHYCYQMLQGKKDYAPISGGAAANSELGVTMSFPYPSDVIASKSIYFTSDFGMRDLGDGVKMHYGVDLHTGAGTPVCAAADGTVETVSYQAGGAGYYVKIDHGNQVRTLYMHLQKGSITVSPGSKVKRGQVIGKEGNTGLSVGATGYHLHFEIRKGGSSNTSAIDPKTIFPFLSGQKGKAIKFNS